MTPLSSALRALREKATRGPFSLAPWDGDDPSEVAECSTILDSEGHDFLNGGRMANEDAERFVLLANSSEQICAALELAEALGRARTALRTEERYDSHQAFWKIMQGEVWDLEDAYRSATRVGP